MSTPGEINSNFYQIVDVDVDGNPTQVKPQYINISNVANSNYANFAGNAFSVDVSNVVGIGNIAIINLNGNGSSYLQGNGNWGGVVATNANYANYSGNAFSVDGSNVVGDVSGANHANISDVANSVSVSNVSGIGNIATINLDGNVGNYLHGDGTWSSVTATNANYANYAGNAFSVDGSNVVGDVSGANHANISDVANSVSVSNVSGIGNIATVNLDGNIANYLQGDGTWGGVVATTANYANYAGNAFSVDGSNVVGDVNGANHANVADVANSVSVSNVSGIGNIATINLDGNIANYLHGDGTWGSVTATNANYANYAGQVIDAIQSNITSLGTLSGLTVSGNLTSGNANLGNLAVANYFSGDGSLLTNITAGNVVGNLPVRFEVKNTTAGTLTKGTPVYITGTVGSTPVLEVAASRADTLSTMGCIGLLEQDLIVNAFGYGLSVGTLTDVNTNSYLVGDELYVGATGGITNIRPNDGNLVQPIGTVGRVSSSTGTIEVNVWDYYRLPNLGNGNIWVGNANSYPTEQVLATSNVGNSTGVLANVPTSAFSYPILFANGNSYANGYYSTMFFNNLTVNKVGTAFTLNVTGTVSVNGNISSGNANLGNLATSNYFSGNGSLLTGVSSSTAATVTSNAQPNITSTGTLISLTVTGNTTTGNIISSGFGNVANVLFTKYSETVVAGGSTGATTLTPNAAAGTIYNYTVTGNITLSTLTNAVAGTSMVVILTQGGSGSYTLTSTMKFAGGTKTLSTAVGAIDIISIFYDGTTYYATLSKGYA